MDQAQQVDRPSDFGTDDQSVVSRWVSELELAEKARKPWLSRGKQIIKKYEGERSASVDVKKREYALLWANIQTLQPAVYARTPTAVVSRRWKDNDPVGRVVSEVLERALNFSLEAMDWEQVLKTLRDEFLLVAQGVGWVRYVPHFAPRKSATGAANDEGAPVEPPDGEITDNQDQYDEVIWEGAIADRVHWTDFLTNPARTWDEVRWVARRAFMDRDELADRFRKKAASGKSVGEECPLDWKPEAVSQTSKDDTQFAKAAVYEIWDKRSRKVFWICRAFTAAPLDVRDDPLKLRQFFPCPRPMLGTCSPDSTIPTPDYDLYRSQAREIDELTKRIGLLTDALKVRGYYAGAENQKLTDLLSAETNTLIPIDSWAVIAEKGGLKGVVDWFPVDMVASTLKSCIEVRQQMLDDVFQLTGIADIMRGDTDPNETLGAQKLKSNWGSSRVRDKQNEVARFARDLIGLMGEVIAQNFSGDTLAQMTGVKLFKDGQEKSAAQNQLQMQAALAQQQGQAPPPIPEETQRMFAAPTWADVEMMMRDNATRAFRIDIETDSTIEPNDQEEKQRRVEFVEAVGQYLEKTLTVVQLAPELLPVVVEGLKFLVRGFRVGREMEDVIDAALDKLSQRAAQAQPQGQQGPNPQVEQAKAQAAVTSAQAAQLSAQAKVMDAHTDQYRAQSEAALGQQQIHTEAATASADRQADLHMQGQDIRADLQQAVIKASERRLIRDINDPRPMEAKTP